MPSDDNTNSRTGRYAGSHRKTSRWQLRRTTTTETVTSDRAGKSGASGGRSTRWTAQEIRALGVSTDLQTAASILGLQPLSAYPINARGAFPVPVIKVGGRYRVPVAPILDLLGLARWPAQS
ncbi:hypothetical protein GCM10010124_31390 [Pilimelia terevasa]|uniref:Uncharacterized protein n=1 Tax=Pilimelia terevasa TaxID=53372 RepID=A0A8J3BQN5_9ACTN|nr:hypothetical protein [Pilimelia terevasa]GGK36470.1 hypothetical protein GCM10010124_31390 [Pilimelia terevasa]